MLEFRFIAPDLRRLDEITSELLIAGMWRDSRPLSGLAGLLDWRLGGRLSRLAKQGFLVGDLGEVLALPGRPRLPFDKVIICGLGTRASFDASAFRTALERIHDVISGLSARKAIIELPGRFDSGFDPDQATDILLDVIPDETRDTLCLVESPEGQRRIEKRAEERYRHALRTQSLMDV